MTKKTYLVITSIAPDTNKILRTYGSYCKNNSVPFILIGDSKSPLAFDLEGCNYYGLRDQKALSFDFAKNVPEKHYARKNIGYLIAANSGADVIIETDDDNLPMIEFWAERFPNQESYIIQNSSWVNIYQYFTKEKIWPRGFALEYLKDKPISINNFPISNVFCPIQQGLANENPDVDAIYRLILNLPFNFENNPNISTGNKTWCPFNSQNTTWFREAFLLLYLPSYCSFRMTDIWRSFVAERICWENDWNVLFHRPTVWQERNDHNLLKDFEDEISGYLYNKKITDTLESLDILSGKENIANNLLKSYTALIDLQLIGRDELPLLKFWIKDMEFILTTKP